MPATQVVDEDRNKTVLFRNFSDQVFSSTKPHKVAGGQNGGTLMIVDENCKWGGEDYTFEPGEARYMPKWKATHFAKHLANRELIRAGMDNDTSPKRPKDNVRFMEMFNKALIEDPKLAGAISEYKGEDQVLNLNKDLEIEALKAENAKLKAAQTGAAVAEEATVAHTITQEDLDANPGLEKDIKVGEEVLLPKAEVIEEKSDLVTPVEDDEEEDGFDLDPSKETTKVA